MTLTASGMLSTPVDALVRLLAASTNFQQLLGDGIGYAEAYDAIEVEEADDSDSETSPENQPMPKSPRPRAIVFLPDGWNNQMAGVGEWKDSGGVDFSLELPIPEEYRFKNVGRYKQEFFYAANLVGAILTDMQNLAGRANADGNPYLNANSFTFTHPLRPCLENEANEYFWGCEIRVGYP
jgi:hypothetical protein